MTRQPASDPRTIYAAHIANRNVIYLDTNIWIDLAQERTPLATEALRLARSAQRSRRVIFPISYSAAIELLKQRVTPATRHQARLMDELSERVSLRAVHHIRDLEAFHVYEYLMDAPKRDLREEMFTAAAWFVGDGSWDYPEGWTEEETARCTALLNRELPGLEWSQEYWPRVDLEERHRESDEDWLRTVSALDQEALRRITNVDGSPSATKLRIEEHVHIIQSYLVKRLPSRVGYAATFLALTRGEERVGRGGPATMRRLVELMPSIWLSCEMHVRRRLEQNRLPRVQDLYDHDHAMVGIPYSDAFVTSDGELLDLVRKCGVQQRYPCELIRGIVGLSDYLQQFESASG